MMNKKFSQIEKTLKYFHLSTPDYIRFLKRCIEQNATKRTAIQQQIVKLLDQIIKLFEDDERLHQRVDLIQKMINEVPIQ